MNDWRLISTHDGSDTRVLIAVTKKDGTAQVAFAAEYHFDTWRVAKVTHNISGIISYIVEKSRVTHWRPMIDLPPFEAQQ